MVIFLCLEGVELKTDYLGLRTHRVLSKNLIFEIVRLIFTRDFSLTVTLAKIIVAAQKDGFRQ